MTDKVRKLPIKKLLHGGDYNPDQWLDYPEILEEDIKLMKQAHVNCVTLGIFSWSRLEPEEGRYDTDWLMEIIDRLYENGFYTILATPTGALPHWMTEKYEEVRKVNGNGIRRGHGQRHNFCPSSPVMRRKMREMNTMLSGRFGMHPGVIAWHISNEYGGDGDGIGCHCAYCEDAFRGWLKRRYQTLDELNHAWWTGFWSNRYTDWNQLHGPSENGEHTMPGIMLDWQRFVSSQILDFCKEEIASVRTHSQLPVTTNLMGTFKPLDYFKWARELDLVSFDNYPMWHATESDMDMAVLTAFCHTLTRSLKKQPFLLMESTPSLANWMPKNTLKRPGMHELSSLQAIAHGSDSVQYFQWRKGRGGFEKYHGAVVDHKNGADTRVFRDVTRLGERLEKLSGRVCGTVNQPKAAIVFDWENWWAVEAAAAIATPFDYRKHVLDHFRVFWEMGIDVDVIDMDDPLEDYSLIMAPTNYMYRGDYIQNVKRFVKQGGIYVTSYWSGEVNESDLCFLGSHPLREVLGIRTEEIDVMPEYVHNRIFYGEKSYAIRELCALVHAETAEVQAVYEKDFYAGYPALTKNCYGKGAAYFIASDNETAFIRDFYCRLLPETGIACSFDAVLPTGVTVTERKGERPEDSVWFLQNYNVYKTDVEIKGSYRDVETGEMCSGTITLDGYECRVLELGRFDK